MHKNIRLITWFNFFTDFRLYAPVAIIYFTRVTGSFALGMSIFSLVMVSSAFLEIPTGIFSDRIGRKRTIVLGAVAASSYALFYALGHSFLVLAIGAILEGLSRAFYSGNNDALLHESLAETKDEERYEEHLGKTESMFQIALALSAIVGSILAAWSFPLIMWLSVIPQLICVALALQMTEPRVQNRESGNIYQHLREAYQKFVQNKKLRLLSLSSILSFGFGEAGYQFQSAFYASLWPIWAIGIAKTLSNVGATASFWFSGKIIKRFGGIEILLGGTLYSRIANILATVFPSVFSPLLMSSTSLFFGASSVAKSGLMQREFTSAQRATMGSLDSFLGSLFFGVVAFALGLVADNLSPAQALLLLQVVQFSLVIIYLQLFRKHRGTSTLAA